MTIDEMIAKLEQIKLTAKNGGATQVALRMSSATERSEWMESAECTLQSCCEIEHCAVWKVLAKGNNTEVVRIYS